MTNRFANEGHNGRARRRPLEELAKQIASAWRGDRPTSPAEEEYAQLLLKRMTLAKENADLKAEPERPR